MIGEMSTNGPGMAGMNQYNMQAQQMLQHQIYRGENSINNGQPSHSSASGQQQHTASSQQHQRPNSLGGAGGNNSSSATTGTQGYQATLGSGLSFQPFNSSSNVANNQNEASYKFTSGGANNAHTNAGSLSGERPMSRGNSGQAKVPPNMQGYIPNSGPQTYQIQQDQQNFHLPPGAFQNGVPNISSGGHGQPQFHFIANKQKFYAQITPDKAPLLFNDKRPFTANNPINGVLPQSNMGSASGLTQGPILGKRGNSNNQKQQQIQQVTHLSTSGIHPPPQLYQNPYHLQIASKTHTGAFGGAGLQNLIVNPLASATVSSKFNVASASNLDTAVSNTSSNNPNQLISIFNPPDRGLQQAPNGVKVKVKAPNRNNLKEKEQLYEDAIKLKIQVNAYREENVRLKTKIKILENDMSKQERAMEEFITKFQVSQANGGATNAITGLSSPLLNAATGGQFSSSSGGQPSGTVVNSNNREISAVNPHMISMMSGLPSNMKPLLQQNETFLVMSLKKQVKELKFECQKKEEDLENVRKSLKNTRQQEIDVEIKTYIDECQRLRQLLSDMLRDGPAHPLYQERMSQLEQQRQSNEFVIASLQAQNQELAKALQLKEEELGQRSGDKAARKEMKQELSKAKKTLRDREKELSRLRQEMMMQKKPNAAGENASFQQKDQNQQTATKTNITEGASMMLSIPQSESKQDQSQTQIKNLQKKVRDLTNDSRSKKTQLDQQESHIKTLEDKLKSKDLELSSMEKKLKQLEEDLSKTKQKDATSKNTNNGGSKLEVKVEANNVKSENTDFENALKKQFGKELELIALVGRKERIQHSDICKKVKVDVSNLLKPWISEVAKEFKDLVAQTSQDVILRVIPYYGLCSEEYTQHLMQDAWIIIKKGSKALSDKFTSEGDIISADKFQEFVKTNSDLKVLSQDILEMLKSRYLETKKSIKPLSNLYFNLKRLLDDAENNSSNSLIQSQPGKSPALNQKKPGTQQPAKKLEKPTAPATRSTAKESEKPQVKKDSLQKSETPLIADIEDDEDDNENYEEDFEKDAQVNAKKQDKAAEEKKEEEKKGEGDGPDAEKPKEKDGKYMDEEEMLDVAEHCFIKMAESLIDRGKTARSIFTKYSVPEQFPDGTILELLSPLGFLEGVKEAAGIEDLTEMEAACLLRVLAKPELDNAIILNEFTMIMENFGVPDLPYPGEAEGAEEEDDDDFDDYVRDEDYFTDLSPEEAAKETDQKPQTGLIAPPPGKKLREKPRRRKIVLNFEELGEKGHKILRKLARFLLERYMHPREFYGPAIQRQMIKTKAGKGDSHPVDILQAKDFYSRLKAAGLRKTANQDENLNLFLRLDPKFPHLMQMKRVVKALEEVAQIEQKKMQEEHQKMIEKLENGDVPDATKKEGAKNAKKGDEVIKEIEEEEEEEQPSLEESEQEEEEEPKPKKKKRGSKKKGKGKNMDLVRETGGYVNDYFASSKGASSKLAGVLGGYTALNTIEEEKHETQTSNYFREAAGVVTESDRDYDNTHIRGSKILDDPDLINTSSKLGTGSPHRADAEFEFPKQHMQNHSSAKHSKGKASDILVENGTPEGKIRSDEKKRNRGKIEHDDYEVKQISIKYENADEDQQEDEYEEDHEPVDDTKDNKKEAEEDQEIEGESDYEF